MYTFMYKNNEMVPNKIITDFAFYLFMYDGKNLKNIKSGTRKQLICHFINVFVCL